VNIDWAQLGNILRASGEHVGILRELNGNDGNFYEINILESIKKSLRIYECLHYKQCLHFKQCMHS
jgi:hypothetical protein